MKKSKILNFLFGLGNGSKPCFEHFLMQFSIFLVTFEVGLEHGWEVELMVRGDDFW